MRPNEKRVAQVAHRVVAASSDAEEVIARALARAERRGEERVLRLVRQFARDVDPHDSVAHSILSEYRKARRARGFPDRYVIDPGGLTKTAQTRMVGNSVSPPVAAALVRANVASADVREVA